MIFNGPVYPICPSYLNDELDLDSSSKYVKFLEDSGAKNVLTTAGTSQFNLLSLDEVYELNKSVAKCFSHNKILGLPPLSLKHLKIEIERLNYLELSNTYILVLFPERYYSDEQVVEYISQVCNISNYGVLLHGNPLKKGKGGSYEYSNELLRKLSKLEKFIGIKEEYTSLDLSIKSIQDLDLEIIVAGGSMRRFWTLQPFGATTFLTGVGSFKPQLSELFFTHFKSEQYSECLSIIQKYETPLFNVFMKIGWHAAMRHGLKDMGYLLENRAPFTILEEDEKSNITLALRNLLS